MEGHENSAVGTYITDSKREKMHRTKSQIGENMYLINQKEIFFFGTDDNDREQ